MDNQYKQQEADEASELSHTPRLESAYTEVSPVFDNVTAAMTRAKLEEYPDTADKR